MPDPEFGVDLVALLGHTGTGRVPKIHHAYSRQTGPVPVPIGLPDCCRPAASASASRVRRVFTLAGRLARVLEFQISSAERFAAERCSYYRAGHSYGRPPDVLTTEPNRPPGALSTERSAPLCRESTWRAVRLCRKNIRRPAVRMPGSVVRTTLRREAFRGRNLKF